MTLAGSVTALLVFVNSLEETASCESSDVEKRFSMAGTL